MVVGDDPEKFFQLGTQLPPRKREELIDFLRKNVDVFMWIVYKAPRMAQTSFAIILMSIHPLSPRNNLLGAHLETIPMQ